MDERTMTLEEWRQAMRLGRSTAYDLASRNEIPGLIRVGSQYRVSRVVTDKVLAGEYERATA